MSIDQLPPVDSGSDDRVDYLVDAGVGNYHMLRIMTEEDANDKSGGAVPGTHGNDAPIAGSDSCSRRPDTRWPGGQPNDRNSDPAYCGSPNPKRPLREQRDINSRCGAAAKAALGGDESTKDARIEAALRMIRGETGEEGGAVAASTDDEDGPSQPPLF
jgi:hypothetical protein